MKGIFTISLDFELHWGGFEKWPLRLNENKSRPLNSPEYFDDYFRSARRVIPAMLALFEKYQVHATWATVGLLLHETRAQLSQNMPALLPEYNSIQLSAYHYIRHYGIGANEAEDPFHFAPSLVAKILQTPNQELGTHTFAHFYCNEPGQTPDQFRADLRAAKKASEKFGVKLESLVFPRNQFNDSYLKVCFEEGIKSVRSNPLDWFWDIGSTQKEPLWKRLNRGLDAYFPVGKKNTYALDSVVVRDGLPLCLPASRLLRPYRPSEWLLNDLKIRRIKAEMKSAALRGEVYHLWWHPHNFARYPAQSLQSLEEILRYFSHCKNNYRMRSLTMGETARLVQEKNGQTKAA